MNAIVPGTESVFIPAEYRVIAGGYQVLTKIDSIVKEEFWRSIGAVYWISFIIIGILIMNDYLPVPLSYIFPLVLILTVAHFLITVEYRRKERESSRSKPHEHLPPCPRVEGTGRGG